MYSDLLWKYRTQLNEECLVTKSQKRCVKTDFFLSSRKKSYLDIFEWFTHISSLIFCFLIPVSFCLFGYLEDLFSLLVFFLLRLQLFSFSFIIAWNFQNLLSIAKEVCGFVLQYALEIINLAILWYRNLYTFQCSSMDIFPIKPFQYIWYS